MGTDRVVVGVASGKGGVGKTTTAVNLAVCLASRGKDVLLLDGDLGLSNAQILLGCTPIFTFADVVAGNKTVEEVIVQCGNGLRLLPGASGMGQLASLSAAEISGLVQAVSALPTCDVLIVDAAAGVSNNVTLLLQACDHQLIVVENEPSSIADAYGMLKVLAKECHLSESLHIVPNRVQNMREGQAMHRLLNDVTLKFLDLSVNYLGSLRQDENVKLAARASKPVVEFAPTSPIATDIRSLADQVMKLPKTSQATGGIQFFMERLVEGGKLGFTMANIGLYQEIQNGAAQEQETVLKHMGLVKRVALHLKGRIPAYMELDELMQVGMIGLIEASKSFDASKGIEFEAFARNRVRGAILDEVRKLSDLPRSAIGHVRDNNEAQQALAAELGRAPTQTELAEYLGKDLDQYQKERAHAHHFQVVAMDELQSDSFEAMPSEYGEPESDIEQAEFMEVLTEAIERLPERERLVISLYYVEEMNLKEIGAVLEVSESRVSQILSSCVKTLRTKLARSM